MSVRSILTIWTGLVALLALTIAASFLRLGGILPFVSYAIAIAKAGLVVWFFMEMRHEDGLQRLALGAGFIWPMILFTLMAADFLARGWTAG